MKVAIACLVVATAAAAEPPPPHEATITWKRLYFRAGLLHVAPQTSSSELSLSGVDGPASLAIMNGPIEGSGATLDTVTHPAVIVGYTLPWLDNRLSIETVLSSPLHVKFRATGTLANMSIAPEALGLPTGVPALGSELGEADAAPPIVTLVYQYARLGALRPYVGAGLSILYTYNAKMTNPVLTEVGDAKFSIDPAPGLVLQTGIDVRLWRSVVARADIKYIALMKAHATVENIRVRTPELPLLEEAEVGSATMDMWVNPLVVQVGIGVDF
jgi:outer membrane protein W